MYLEDIYLPLDLRDYIFIVFIVLMQIHRICIHKNTNSTGSVQDYSKVLLTEYQVCAPIYLYIHTYTYVYIHTYIYKVYVRQLCMTEKYFRCANEKKS